MRKRALFIAATSTLAALGGSSVRADISGFSGFAPYNIQGVAPISTGYSLNGSTFTVTDNQQGEAVSGFYPTPQNITSFLAMFTYTVPGGNGQNPQYSQADGIDFVVQNDPAGTAAIGGGGGDKGYGGIQNSAALGFEMYGGASSDIIVNGSEQDNGTFDVNNGDPLQVTVRYAAHTLSISAYDPVTHQVSYASTTGVDLPAAVGGNTALVGITGGTGGSASYQTVSNFSFKTTPTLTYTPISLTSASFNQKMIIAANAPTSGAASSITATMDDGTSKGGTTFYEVGYDPSNTGGNTGVPASGSTFVSQADPNHTFQMQNYSNNDALLLDSASPTGSLVFSSPKAMSALSFLTATGNGDNGAGSFDVTINYSDGTPSTVIPYSVISPDWFFNGPVAWDANGRAYADPTNATGYDNVDNNEPNLYQIDLSLPDSIDPITSVSLTYAGQSPNSQVAVYALSGVPSSVPEPTMVGVMCAVAGGLLTRRRRTR